MMPWAYLSVKYEADINKKHVNIHKSHMSLTDPCLTRLIEGTVRKKNIPSFENWTEARYAGAVRLKVGGTEYAISERTVPHSPAKRCLIIEHCIPYSTTILQSHLFQLSQKFESLGCQSYGVKRFKSIFANKGNISGTKFALLLYYLK